MHRELHIVWHPVTGPIAAYENPSLAHAHAENMVGVRVSPCELLSRLPDVVLEDRVSREYDTEDETPVVLIEDVDDG